MATRRARGVKVHDDPEARERRIGWRGTGSRHSPECAGVYGVSDLEVRPPIEQRLPVWRGGGHYGVHRHRAKRLCRAPLLQVGQVRAHAGHFRAGRARPLDLVGRPSCMQRVAPAQGSGRDQNAPCTRAAGQSRDLAKGIPALLKAKVVMVSGSWTEDSRVRLEVARRLCRTCPSDFGREIAVTGSVARGTADKHSDVEVNLWADTISDAAERREWFESVGCTDVVLDREISGDGTVWSHLSFDGILVEAGWQTIGAVDQEIDDLLRGRTTDHRMLEKAWVIETAVALRSAGAVNLWQQRLSRYPSALATELIMDASNEWRFPHILDSRWSLAERNQVFTCTQTIVKDLERVLRIVFAVNRRWEPDWKWLHFVTRDLAELPVGVQERVGRALTDHNLTARVWYTLELASDALTLAADICDVSKAAANVRRSLAEHS